MNQTNVGAQNKLICKSTLLLLLLIASATTDARWIMDANIATAFNRETASDTNRDFFDNATQAHATGNDRRTAFHFGLSIPTDEAYYTHLSYVDLGKVNPALMGRQDAVTHYVNNLTDLPLHQLQGLTFSLRREIPLNDVLSLRISGGLFHWNARYQLKNSIKPLTREDSGLSHTLGLGLNLVVADNYSVQLSWDAYSTQNETVDVMSLGLQWFVGGRPQTKTTD